jgi:O-antigen biosynthesis protein
MQDSGEQFVPGESPARLQQEHLARYRFARNFCEGKSVLDIACGTGYGAYELSTIARSVVGVDISEAAISFAQERYQRENLSFIKGDGTVLKFEENMFDVIVSFETIEHLNKDQRVSFYQHLSHALKDEGILVFSTPNKKITSPYTKKPLNPFHVLEFTKSELRKELEQFFLIKDWYGQRFVLRILTYPLVRKSVRVIEVLSQRDFGFYLTRYSADVTRWSSCNQEPRIMLAILGKRVFHDV